MIELTGQVAVVTGAGRGIGAATAHCLANLGAKVHLLSRSLAPAQSVVKEIEASGARGQAWAVDVTDRDEVDRVFRRIKSSEGRLDILVNNAGATQDALTVRMGDEAWESVLKVNLTGSFYCTRAALRIMIRQKRGKIVNVSSVVGVVGNVGQSNYAAAKAGLIGLTKTVAREVAARGITVNAVAPGMIDTRMLSSISDEEKASLLRQVPLGRLGKTSEIAAAIAFLASSASSYMTGCVLQVDGGLCI